MKKIFSFVLILIFASAISFSLGAMICESFRGFLSVSLFGGVAIAYFLRMFKDDKKEMKL